MASATAPHKTVSIYDYPEHLNPFREDDNHNKIRFWTISKRLTRTNSFTGLKDLKNSWAFRSFLRKGKKGHDVSSKENSKEPVKDNRTNNINGENSPIVFRRALQYSSTSRSGDRSTVGSPDRYVYGGSVTPLPRSRFQERLRSASQQEVGVMGTPRMARSEVSGSRLSVESTNPFDEPPVPPVRASRRKKKRAPAPPTAPTADISVSSENSELVITEIEDTKKVITDPEIPKPAFKTDDDLELEEIPTDIELKIVEDEDDKINYKETETKDRRTVDIQEAKTLETTSNDQKETVDVRETKVKETTSISHLTSPVVSKTELKDEENNTNKTTGSEDDILNSVSFPKIDIVKYRRNSSVNDDDIRLRRGNLEDFHSLSTKRSKSLTNTADASFITYDINLNENIITKDQNRNEEPQKVVCKVYDNPRKASNDDSISSTEKEFLEIEKVRKEFEREINKLNAALAEDDFSSLGSRKSVSEIRRQFDKSDMTSPNPIPKPKRSHPGSPLNGNIQTPLSSL